MVGSWCYEMAILHQAIHIDWAKSSGFRIWNEAEWLEMHANIQFKFLNILNITNVAIKSILIPENQSLTCREVKHLKFPLIFTHSFPQWKFIWCRPFWIPGDGLVFKCALRCCFGYTLLKMLALWYNILMPIKYHICLRYLLEVNTLLRFIWCI